MITIDKKFSSFLLGVLPAWGRQYLHAACTQRPTHITSFVNPTSGLFTDVQIAVGSGFVSDRCFCSDTGIVPTIVGTYVTGGDLDKLGFVSEKETPVALSDYKNDAERAACMLLTIKINTLDAEKNPLFHNRLAGLLEDIQPYKEKIAQQLRLLRERLGGIHFSINDIVAEVGMYADREDALIFASPPGYKGGYEKQWRGVKWNAPPPIPILRKYQKI